MSSKRIRLSAQPNLHFASLLWPLLRLYAIQLSTYNALHAVYYVPKKEDVQLVWHHSALALKRRERRVGINSEALHVKEAGCV